MKPESTALSKAPPSQNRSLFFAALGFVGFCIVAYWAWSIGLQSFYASFFAASAAFVHSIFGVEGIPIATNRPQYLNWIPFVAFMLVTYSVDPKRRLVSTAIGLVVLHLGHLFLNASPHIVDFGREGLDPMAPAPTWMIISDGLPLLLWVLFVPEMFNPGRREQSRPSADPE